MQVSQGYAEPDWGYGHYGNWKKNMSPRGGKQQPMGPPMMDHGYPYAKSSQGLRSGRKSPTLNKRATDDPKKVFVGGLPKEATKENIKEYFGKFGEVDDCYVVTDPKTGRTRGFGFVKYDNTAAVEEVMDARPHTLLDKPLMVKRVLNMEKQENLFTSKKLFVGGLKDQTEEDLRDFFSKFGNIEEVTVAKDKEGNPRKFAMITFDDYDSVDKVMALGKRSHSVKGGDVGCKKFLSKEELAKVDNVRRDRYAAEQHDAAAEWSAIHGYGPAMMEQHMAHMSLGPAGYGPQGNGGGGGQDFGYGAYSHMIGKERRGGGGGKKPSLLQQASMYYSGPTNYGYGGAPAQGGNYGQGDGYGAVPPENKFMSKLQQANVSEEGMAALARENLLNPDVLASLNPVEFAQVPLKIGDRKRVQIVLGSIGYGGN